MKKLLLFLGLVFTTYSYSQTILLSESFEDIEALQGWTATNQSTEPYYDWLQGLENDFPAYEGSSYLAANYAASFWDYISLWMISPTLELKDGDVISFYTRTYSVEYPDRLQLRLSQGATFTQPNGDLDVGSFTSLLLDINPELNSNGYPDTWTLQTIEIQGLGNSPVPVNFAFRYFIEDGGLFGSNGNLIGIDELTVTREDDLEPAGCLTAVNGQWPEEEFTPQCYGVFSSSTSGDWGFFGEYSLINVNEGVEYTFATDVETAFITIGDEAGQTVLAAGTGNVVWTSTFTGKVRYYTHLDEACSGDGGWVDRMVKCGEEIIVESCEDNFVPSNGFEDGATTDGQRLAVDVIVGDGGFTVTGIQVNAFSETADATFSAKLHTDNNGVPGDELISTEGTVIGSTVVGNNFGVDVYAFDVKFDDPFVLDANSTYWIEIIASGINSWEVSYGYHMGHGIGFNHAGTGNQWESYGSADLVYALICGEEPTGETCEDNFVASNGFEDGATLDDQRLAVDVLVGDAGFTVKGIQVNAFSQTADATFSAKLHTDNNGVPGDELLSTEGTVIASTVVGNNFGVDVYAFDVKLEDPFVLDANSTYWIEIIASGVIAWEVSLGDYIGNGIAFNNPNTGNQWISADFADLVYALICEDLGASDLAQFDFTYYPNPVKDYLTIQSKLAVKFVEVYNMVGQRISNNLKYVNGQVNTSQLPSGVYVFRVGLENGQIETFKVIKK